MPQARTKDATAGMSGPTGVTTAAATPPATAPPSGTDLSGVGQVASDLGLSSGFSSALPYLVSGGLGLYQANQAAGQNANASTQMADLGKPYTDQSTQLLNRYNTGALTPAQQNVVQTLQSQGQALIDSASPLSQIANTAFANYQAGQLNPGQQQQIDSWVASAQQELRQTLASSGISDSSILASQDAAIQSQATQLKANLMAQNLQVGDQQYSLWLTSTQAGQQLQAQGAQYAATSLDNMLNQALQFGQLGMEPQMQAIRQALQSDQQLSGNVGNLMKSLAGAYAAANKPSAGSIASGLSSLFKGSGSSAGGSSGGLTPEQIREGGGVAGNAVGSQYDMSGTVQVSDPTLSTPSMDQIQAGMTMPDFNSSGYDLSGGDTVDTTTFDNYFFDPGSTDLGNIDFNV